MDPLEPCRAPLILPTARPVRRHRVPPRKGLSPETAICSLQSSLAPSGLPFPEAWGVCRRLHVSPKGVTAEGGDEERKEAHG